MPVLKRLEKKGAVKPTWFVLVIWRSGILNSIYLQYDSEFINLKNEIPAIQVIGSGSEGNAGWFATFTHSPQAPSLTHFRNFPKNMKLLFDLS